MNKSTTKHIVFDVHNVLFEPDYKAIIKILLKIPNKLEIIYFLCNIKLLMLVTKSAYKHGLGQGFLNLIMRHYPKLINYEHIFIALTSAQKPIHSTFLLVKHFKAYYPIHILSNMGFHTLKELQYKFSYHFTHFDTINYFGVGSNWQQKSHMIPYKKLIKKLKTSYHNILFIDNNKRNIILAKMLGIKAIHYTSAAQLRKDLAQEGLFINNN